MNRFQTFLAASACTMAAVACFSLSAFAAPHDELKFLPKETTFILQVDVSTLQKTKLFKDVALTNPVFLQGIQRMKDELGVDPLASIKTMTMGFGASGDGKDMSIVIDMPLKLDAKPLTKPGAKKLSHRGQTYFDLGKDGAALILKDHSVLGQKERIIKTIDQLQSKGALQSPLGAQSKARDAKAQIWFFGRPPAAQVGAVANQVKAIKGNVDLTDGLRASVSVEADPNWVKVVSGSIAMQKMNAGQNPMMAATGIGPMFQKLVVTDNAGTLSMSIRLTAQEVDKLKGLAAMFAAQQAQGAGGMPTPTMPGQAPQLGTTPPGMSPMPKPPVGQPLAPPKAPTPATAPAKPTKK
ncbi:MAG: hypothetical protein VX589_20795 [Myxococcota bacterium]|nr:hypothetical protein [Myxococcota bacterium]